MNCEYTVSELFLLPEITEIFVNPMIQLNFIEGTVAPTLFRHLLPFSGLHENHAGLNQLS